MNLRNVPVLVALVALVAAGGYLVASRHGDPEGLATGRVSRVQELWDRLGRYHDSYLRAWKRDLRGPAPAPGDVLAAFNEVGFQVTGPGGFWRKELPGRWLGCKAEPDSTPCVRLGDAEPELARSDKLLEEIAAVPQAEAARFIDQNFDRLAEYLDDYVPPEPTASGMEQTRFFDRNLKGAMQSEGLL